MSCVFNPQTASKKKVMIGLKSQSYSSQFLVSWTMMLNHLWKNDKYEVNVSQGFSKNQFISRLQSVGLDVSKPINDQKHFQGTDYDVFVMLDSDILFNPEDMSKLIDLCATRHDVVSGLYPMDTTHYFVGDATEKELVKISDIEKDDKETVEVPFTGLGFFACKKKVLDTVPNPYFDNALTEEIGFCKKVRDLGFKVMLCKELRVSRELNVVF
jgi:hypothetical protein